MRRALRHSCDYCGLIFSGEGYSPDGERRFCCYGCCLIDRILGAQGGQGIAAWILLRLGIGAFFAMNVMMISLVLYTHSENELGAGVLQGFRWAMVVLSTPAVLILGGPFILGAVRDLLRARISTDALIVTGSLAAYGVSTAHVIRQTGHVYFDTATMLLLIVTLGRLLEAAAKSRTSRAIRDIMDLAPPRARILRDGEEAEVPSGEVRKGDLMIVRPGERLPADGRIVSGECMVEEAAFTGEARPRSCSPEDRVFGGSVNCDGLITVEATAVGADALLAQIHDMVEQAQQERAPIERLTERVASVFVPAVWAVAAGAAAYWGLARGDGERAGLSALAVLVVACPCALGLATPVATCLAIGRAARAGVLIRSGEVLERLPAVGKVFFDKTGTLTAGDLAVAAVHALSPDIPADEALSWAASLEAGSEHAIARAIVAAARARGLPQGNVTDLRTFSGRGVAGIVTMSGRTRRVVAGSPHLIAEWEARSPAAEVPDSDLSTTCVSLDGEPVAAIALSDRVRPEAAEAIARLRASGIEVAVISGDREGPTRRLAQALGIDEYLWECTPEEKQQVVRPRHKSFEGSPLVAMVGDGINDAPALAGADVGIATGGGTDLARQSSDVTLLGDDLLRIPWALELARTTYRIIRQNLLWAFGYNSAAIVLAFLGFVHPLIAAGAMVASSVAVITNSLRLLPVSRDI